MKRADLCTQGSASSLIEKICCGKKRSYTVGTRKIIGVEKKYGV